MTARLRPRAVIPLLFLIMITAACAPPATAPADEVMADPPTASPTRVATPSVAASPTPTPSPTPTAPAPGSPGTTCGPIGYGLVAVVARGQADCPTAVAVLKKFVGADGTEIGRTTDVDGWGCSILDGSLPETASIYTFAYECAVKQTLIKAWPADSPLPPGTHQEVKHFAGDFVPGGYLYSFSVGKSFSCQIVPPPDDGPGSVLCFGQLPADAKAPKGKGPANSVQLERDRKARFVSSGDPPNQRIRELAQGQVLAFYGVACGSESGPAVRCINGEHEFTLRPGSAELS
ncbi:hypothetical protein [Microlunatus speluncae]|uniref:hypothetical protein n=1 Tax=Microlunatus speluncae TaxID=2594267 RepID=UPI0012664621|nr:hypothetical protein [Microlunatus speluncae]